MDTLIYQVNIWQCKHTRQLIQIIQWGNALIYSRHTQCTYYNRWQANVNMDVMKGSMIECVLILVWHWIMIGEMTGNDIRVLLVYILLGYRWFVTVGFETYIGNEQKNSTPLKWKFENLAVRPDFQQNNSVENILFTPFDIT